MNSKGYKGSDFEREICKKLSVWWTGGGRDDVFWRSSQSGGRATQRSKKGLRTHGSYGDISAVDPVGEPLLKLFTIELKRGSSHGSPGDLLDFKKDNEAHPWVKCLLQTIRSAEQAGSVSWMMICRRDHRLPVCFMPASIYRELHKGGLYPMVRFRLTIALYDYHDFVGIPLDQFLSRTSPGQIIEAVAMNYKK